MRSFYSLLAIAVAAPTFVHAQGLVDYIENVTLFLDSVVIPFLLGIAFLIFVINAVRFFIFQSSNEEGREKARSLMTYSVLAFVLLLTFMGIINLLSTSVGLTDSQIGSDGIPKSDYIEQNGGGGGSPFGDDPCSTNPNSPSCLGNASTG